MIRLIFNIQKVELFYTNVGKHVSEVTDWVRTCTICLLCFRCLITFEDARQNALFCPFANYLFQLSLLSTFTRH